jgi:hypothetical protein
MSFEFANPFWRGRKEHSLPGNALQKRAVAVLNDEHLPTDSAEEPILRTSNQHHHTPPLTALHCLPAFDEGRRRRREPWRWRLSGFFHIILLRPTTGY